MGNNPLKIPYSGKRERDLMACELAAICRETGQFDKAKLWDREASDRGEERLPNGVTARFRDDGTIERVWFGQSRA